MRIAIAAGGVPSAAILFSRHLLRYLCYASIRHYSDYIDWHGYPNLPNKQGYLDCADWHNRLTVFAYGYTLKRHVLYS